MIKHVCIVPRLAALCLPRSLTIPEISLAPRPTPVEECDRPRSPKAQKDYPAFNSAMQEVGATRIGEQYGNNC